MTAWVPLSSITAIKEEGKKSIHVDYVKNKLYNIKEIPCVIKRVYPRCDLHVLEREDDNERKFGSGSE